MPDGVSYPAKDVDAFMARALNGSRRILEACNDLYEKNAALTQENETLRKAASSTSSITLEKVATASGEKVRGFINRLVDMSLLDDSQAEKAAAACIKDPNQIIDLAETAIKLSTAPLPQGYGTEKSAQSAIDSENSLSSLEREAWDRCLREGL